MDRIQNPIDAREIIVLAFGSGRYPVAASQYGNRSVQIIEGERAHIRSNRVHKRAAFGRIAYEQKLTGFLYRFDDFFVVQRIDPANVDNFGIHAVLFFKRFRGVHCSVQRGTQRCNRDVCAGFADCRFSFRNFVVTGRNFFFEFFAFIIELLAFEEDNRIRAAQRVVQHTLCVVGRCGEHRFKAGNCGDQSAPVLTVLGAVFVADRNAYGKRHFQKSCRHRLPF